MRVILLCSQAFDVLLHRSTSGVRLLSAPEAAGQNGDTYPDLELCTAHVSVALAAITNAGHRRTNQMQEPHIDHSVSSSHMTSPQQGLERKGGANHTQSDARECMSSVLLSLSDSLFVSLMLKHNDFEHLTFSCPSHFPLFALQQISADSWLSGEACLCFNSAHCCYKFI